MLFKHFLQRLIRLLLGLTRVSNGKSPESVNLALFDHIPLLRRFASRYFFHRFRRLVPGQESPVHTFCVGRSGSGKSEVLKLLALAEKTRPSWRASRRIRRDGSLVLIDPHGDLARQLARQWPYGHDARRHSDDPDLIYLDPCLAIQQDRFPALNPFDLYSSQHSELKRERSAQQLTAVLRSLTCKSDETLSTNMETLLYPCLSVLLSRPGSTLHDLLRFVNSSGNDDLLSLGLRAPNGAHRYFFRHSFNERRFAPTRGAVSTKIQSLLNSRAFAAFLAQPRSSVNLEQALNSGKSIILSCAAGQLGTQTMSAIGRFVVGMVLAVAFNRSESAAYRRPIRLIIDEMQHFVSDEMITILTEARKYGLHLTLACQIVGQSMSPQLNRIILGNTGLKLLGDAGADSRRIMAKEMGITAASAEALKVGQFLIRHRHAPPICCRFTNAHIDRKQSMSSSRWSEIKRDQIQRWYPRFAGPGPPDRREQRQTDHPVVPNTLDFDL